MIIEYLIIYKIYVYMDMDIDIFFILEFLS